MLINFDDGSTFDIGMYADLRKAYAIAFGKLDVMKCEILVNAATDWFWEKRQEPDARGEVVAWAFEYKTKGELAYAVLKKYLHFQFIASQGDMEKFTFKLANEETYKALRGQLAIKACNNFSKAYLFGFGKKSLLDSGLQQIEAKSPDAKEIFEAIVDLDPDDGTALYWLAILLRREGNTTRAKQMFGRAADLLGSPYADRARCPTCGWVPIGTAMWNCESCKEAVDVFETHGDCSKCGKRMEETLCPACSAKSPHGTWWSVIG